MENGEWKMNDTVYGVSPGLVLHEMYTVGCADLGAPSLTIVTCVTVWANIVRPQHDRSLCRERPRTRLTITREHTVLPYGYAFADEFTNGAPRSYPRAPSLAATPQFTLAHPTVYISYGDIAMRRRLNHSVHSPFSIFHPPLFRKKEQRPALSKRNAVISLHFYQICEVNTL